MPTRATAARRKTTKPARSGDYARGWRDGTTLLLGLIGNALTVEQRDYLVAVGRRVLDATPTKEKT